jgi:hypothetical protein
MNSLVRRAQARSQIAMDDFLKVNLFAANPQYNGHPASKIVTQKGYREENVCP